MVEEEVPVMAVEGTEFPNIKLCRRQVSLHIRGLLTDAET